MFATSLCRANLMQIHFVIQYYVPPNKYILLQDIKKTDRCINQLTLFGISTFEPFSTNRVTMLMLPYFAATCRGAMT